VRNPRAHRMRPSAILSEAFRNLTSGTSAAVVLALLMGTFCGGLAIIDAQAVTGLEDAVKAFVTTGASVRTLAAKGQVDPLACDRLSGTAPVRATGALREAAAVTLLAAPANAIPRYLVTPGMARVLGVSATAPAGVWMSTDLATLLGAVPGVTLTTAHGQLTLAGTFPWPRDGRDERFGYAVVQPVPPSDAAMDECWADLRPPGTSADSLLRSATFVTAAGAIDAVQIAQLNQTQGTPPDARHTFTTRPTRFVWLGCLTLGLLIGWGAVRRRRLEYSAALHSGQPRRALIATAVLETCVWAATGFLIAAVTLALTLATTTDEPVREIFLLDLRGPVLAVLAGLAGTILPLMFLSERHLFRYFKDR
jgi:hypothetical protein